ncbi:MAG: efflux RND transporter periplasmic adaptor subunit [Ignavibacteriae bacterium]|nr:efflux RND transporter periplasmic adaptor subunit [Ignavibacteriota bacterium]
MATNGKRSKKKIIIFSIIGVVVAVLVLLVILGSNRETVVTVQTEPVEQRAITQTVAATGKIQPEVQVKINAEVSGEIIDLPVKEGERVKKGQLLARIKPDAYEAQVERAQAALAITKANLSKAEADFKRASELFDKNLVSGSDMDFARATFESAKASFNQSSAALKEARETLAKTTIYSPMEGVVSQLLLEVGVRVSGSQFTQGTEVMTVADLSRMESRVDVGENDVVMVSIGDTASVEVDAYSGRKIIGTVSRIANTAKTRGLGTQDEVVNFEVRILMHPPEDVQLRPGMSMTADIFTETRSGVFAVPIQSVTVRQPKETPAGAPAEQAQEGEAQFVKKDAKKKEEDKLQEVVFAVKDGKIISVPVKRGISDDTYVEITEGLEAGLEVVTGPFRAINRDLQEGTAVKVDNKQTRQTGSSVAQSN